MEKQNLINIFNEILFPLGYKRKGNNWIRTESYLTKVINLQKSNFSNLYYVNIRLIINGLDLKQEKSHIWLRLHSENKQTNALICDLLDFENNISAPDRKIGLEKILKTLMLPILSEINTINDLKNLIKQSTIVRNSTSSHVMEYLNIPE